MELTLLSMKKALQESNARKSLKINNLSIILEFSMKTITGI